MKFVKKDIRFMIQKGWFLEGQTDQKETCLITSTETYRQYTETQKALEQRNEEECRKRQQETEQQKQISPEVQEVLDKGEAYIQKIHASNDAIPGEEISAKIARMEQIVEQIFQRAEEHPEIIPDLKKMMDYYLPMTVKLLDAYEEMDRQPIQGETIRSSKKEIEDTLDTLNEAFAKLLDSVFQDTAWDVSRDAVTYTGTRFCTGSEEGAGSAGTRTTDGSCTGNGSGPTEDGTDSTDTGRTEDGGRFCI